MQNIFREKSKTQSNVRGGRRRSVKTLAYAGL